MCGSAITTSVIGRAPDPMVGLLACVVTLEILALSLVSFTVSWQMFLLSA